MNYGEPIDVVAKAFYHSYNDAMGRRSKEWDDLSRPVKNKYKRVATYAIMELQAINKKKNNGSN